MPITYIDRGPVDDRALSELHDLAFGGTLTGHTQPWRARLDRYSVAWVCAYESTELVGFVHACGDGGAHAFLLDTAVRPDRQHHGIGRELVRRLSRQVRQAGCEWLHVDFEPHLEGFYRSCGFLPTAAGLQRLT